MGKLNTAKLRTLASPGVHGDGGGLYLQVRDADHRSWIFRYTIHGKARWMGLGPFADVGLAEAREAAMAARKQVRQGADPIDARKAEAIARAAAAGQHKFSEVANAYIAAHETSWRNDKHRAQWHSTLATYVAPVLGNLPVASVDVDGITRVLEPIWRVKPETASRIRGRIETILDYATARGWRTGENPARWKGHLENLMPARGKIAAVEHHAALPWKEIGAFMADLSKEDVVSAMALQLLILTAARTNEILGARWSEFDITEAVWTVPGARMKAGREHRVPLSDAAVSILKNVAKLRKSEAPDLLVFTGRKSERGKGPEQYGAPHVAAPDGTG